MHERQHDCPFCAAPACSGPGRVNASGLFLCTAPVGPHGLGCTRERGHAGPHVACGINSDMHPIAVEGHDGQEVRVGLTHEHEHEGV